MLLLLLNTVDFAVGMILLVSMLLGAWGDSTVLTLSIYVFHLIVLVVLVSCFGVMRHPGRRCLTLSSWTALVSLLVELVAVVFVLAVGRGKFMHATHLHRETSTGDIVYRILCHVWIVAVFAGRHLVRYVLTVGLRAARDDIANDTARADAAEQQNALSERLIEREIRRGHRDELRAHFNHKYFEGRTAQGDPSPTVQDYRPRAELPSYVFTEHRNSLTSGDEPQLDWAA